MGAQQHQGRLSRLLLVARGGRRRWVKLNVASDGCAVVAELVHPRAVLRCGRVVRAPRRASAALFAHWVFSWLATGASVVKPGCIRLSTRCTLQVVPLPLHSGL